MSMLALGLTFGLVTLLFMMSGAPIAFALGSVAVLFMALFMPAASLDTITQNVYEEMASITLLSIPLFILKGAAIGRSRAGQDLYAALHAWMSRVPGGLGIANVFACALFAAMAGSSPATCSAIGSAGIPEMRKRGYSPGFAAGIIAAGGTLGILLPPSITMILYAVAAEQSLGRLFLAGIGPGLLLVELVRRLRGLALAPRAPQRDRRARLLRHRLGAARRRALHAAPEGRDAAARAAVRDPADRRDGRALRRLRDAVRDRRPRRPARTGPDRRRLRRLARSRRGADPVGDAQGIDDADVHHRHVAAVLVRDELPAHQPVDGAMDRRAAAVEVAAAGGDPVPGDRPRLFPAAGEHHPDDRADRPAAAQGRRLRPGLVRHPDDDRDGGRTDPSAGRPEPVRDQEHRARHHARRDHPRRLAVRRPDVPRRAPDLHRCRRSRRRCPMR